MLCEWLDLAALCEAMAAGNVKVSRGEPRNEYKPHSLVHNARELSIVKRSLHLLSTSCSEAEASALLVIS